MNIRAVTIILIVTGILGVVLASVYWIRSGYIISVFVQLVGQILALEGLSLYFRAGNYSKDISHRIKRMFMLFVLGIAVGGSIFDAVGLLIIKAYEYPAFGPLTNPFGYVNILLLWGMYFLIVDQSFRLVHHFLRRKIEYTDQFSTVFAFCGPVGLMVFSVALAFSLMTGSTFLGGTVAAIGIWLVLEGFKPRNGHPTLLLNLLNGNIRPLATIIVCSVIFGLLSEYPNAASPTQLWVYYGVPLKKFSLFGVPVILLLSWSWMYVIFLSVENILLSQERGVWE